MPGTANLRVALALLGTLVAFTAGVTAKAPATPLLQGTPSLTVIVDCDGLGGNLVSLAYNATTMIATGSCAAVTLDWKVNNGDNLRATATLTTALTAGVSLPAADHEVKITGNLFGDISAATAFTPLSTPVNLWEEAITAGEQNRSDTFSVDFQLNMSALLILEPGTYNGQIEVVLAIF